MKKKLVKVEFDPLNPPALTARQKAELEKLAAKPEEKIDLSDIPALDEKFWRYALHGGLYRPAKASTTVRLDSDVLVWLRSKGKGYQTRINAILRQAMLEEARQRTGAK